MTIFISGGGSGLTWADARAKVRGDLWRPGGSLPDDVVDRALHASVLELEAETSWLWLENLTTLVTIDQPADFVDLSPVIGHVGAVSYRKNDRLERLTETTLSTVRVASQRVGGDPSFFAFADGRLWFDCSVAAGAEFEVVCATATPEIMEDAIQSPSVTLSRQQQAVIANACSIVALNFMKNGEEAERQRAVYERILDRLMSTEASRRGAGIIPDTWGMCHG